MKSVWYISCFIFNVPSSSLKNIIAKIKDTYGSIKGILIYMRRSYLITQYWQSKDIWLSIMNMQVYSHRPVLLQGLIKMSNHKVGRHSFCLCQLNFTRVSVSIFQFHKGGAGDAKTPSINSATLKYNRWSVALINRNPLPV